MAEARDRIFDYDALPLLGRVSLRLSNSLIVSNLQPGSWLDLLCGYRAELQVSQRHKPHIDSFYCLDHALDQELAEHGFYLTEHTLEKKLPYESGKFDNITIVNGLEHLWYPDHVVMECHRTLKIGGSLQVVLPTWLAKPVLEFLAFKIRNKQAYLEMNDHKMYYDEKTLWPMLVRAGFLPGSIHIKRTKLLFSLYAHATKRRDLQPPVSN